MTEYGQKMPEISSAKLSDPLKIGPVSIPNRVFLAPMSGVTDLPFRRQARKFGAGAVVSEMVASEALVRGHAEMQLKAALEDTELNIVQLAGREATWMARAAELAESSGADIIDINMGCPAKKVTNGYSGSALMRDLDHAETLISAVVGAVQVPVTLKMRLGWDPATLNAPELAKRAENNGVSMITVHGRTRSQFYKGTADWSAVAAVKQAVSLPVVVNGDIACSRSARKALEKSGADGIMVGRACCGSPWLPGMLAGSVSADEAKVLERNVDIFVEHYEEILSFYGTGPGVRHARKHLSAYMANFGNDDEQTRLKKQVLTTNSPDKAIGWLRQLFDPGQPLQAGTLLVRA